jgi:hypothetical protein
MHKRYFYWNTKWSLAHMKLWFTCPSIPVRIIAARKHTVQICGNGSDDKAVMYATIPTDMPANMGYELL